MNIINSFIEQCQNNPDKLAIIAAERSITYRQLAVNSTLLAESMRDQGLATGDVVLVLLPFSVKLYEVLLALFRLGAPALFPDYSAGVNGIKNSLKQKRAKAFIGDWKTNLLRNFVKELRDIPLNLSFKVKNKQFSPDYTTLVGDLSVDDPALITFTSGSTGQPKGIARTHEFLMKQQRQISLTLNPQRQDIVLVSLPVFVLSNLASGVTSVLPAANILKPAAIKPRSIFKQISVCQVNSLILPPAFCQRLVAAEKSLPNIKKVFTGGGPVLPELIKKLQQLAPRAEIMCVYGSTEAEPIAHIYAHEITDEDYVAMRHGKGLLVGYPVDNIQIKLVDQEIVVTGEHVVQGYLNPADDRTTKIDSGGQIWHRTGDAGRFDQRGRLWLLGRHAARYGNIFPFCVEVATLSYPGIKQAAFFALQEQAVLVIETDREFKEATSRKISARFPDYKIIRARIPMDKRHNSKVDYARLKRMPIA